MTIEQAKKLKAGDKVKTSVSTATVTLVTRMRETADDVQVDFLLPSGKSLYLQTNGKSAVHFAQLELIA